MDTLGHLTWCAQNRRCAVIDYRKPTDTQPIQRLIEPYQLQYNGEDLMVLCWQLDPAIDERTCWRTFRVDRILAAYDGQHPFTPRIHVTLGTGEAQPWQMHAEPRGTLGTVNQYYELLENALLDGKVTQGEMDRAEEVGRHLAEDQIKACHAQLFLSVLRECLIDGEISYAEVQYLAKVRRMLKKLGWAP